jgi:hypothetical protein
LESKRLGASNPAAEHYRAAHVRELPRGQPYTAAAVSA